MSDLGCTCKGTVWSQQKYKWHFNVIRTCRRDQVGRRQGVCGNTAWGVVCKCRLEYSNNLHAICLLGELLYDMFQLPLKQSWLANRQLTSNQLTNLPILLEHTYCKKQKPYVMLMPSFARRSNRQLLWLCLLSWPCDHITCNIRHDNSHLLVALINIFC